MERNTIKQQQTQAHRSFVVNVWSLHLKRVEWPGHMARIHIGTGWMHHVFCAVCWTCFHVSRGFLLAKAYDKTHHATYMHWSACVRLWAIQIHIDKWPSEPLCIYLFARQPQKPKTAHNEARFCLIKCISLLCHLLGQRVRAFRCICQCRRRRRSCQCLMPNDDDQFIANALWPSAWFSTNQNINNFCRK